MVVLSSDVVRPWLLTMAAVLAAMVPVNARAQELVPIRDAGRCATCQITLEHVVTLGDREGPGRVMPPNAEIVRDSRGNYYVAHADGGRGAASIWVFDQAGAFVRTIGRRGEGPGEYQGIWRLRFRAGDTLEVYSSSRRTILAPDLTVVSTNRVEVGSQSSVFLRDGRAVVNRHIATPDRVGYPLQLVSEFGRIVRSFGAIRPEYRPGEPMKVMRAVAAGPDGGSVWSIGRGDYLIELWDTTGVRRAAFQRDVEWFEPYVLDRFEGPVGPPPQPMVSLVMRDTNGRLWLSVLVAAEDWRDAYRRVGGRWDVASDDLHKLHDTILEVLDPSARRLVASRRFQGQQFVSFIGDHMIASFRQDEEGYPLLDVWRIAVTGVP